MGPPAWNERLKELRAEASQAIAEGVAILVLSRSRRESRQRADSVAVGGEQCASSSDCAKGRALVAGSVIETGEAREVHHFALLTAYGAGAVNPYLALATLDDHAGAALSAGELHAQAVAEKLS